MFSPAQNCADEPSSDSSSTTRFHLIRCCVLMRIPRSALPLVAVALLAGCGTPGAPLPPTLDLPQPPSDLKATRKGEKVTLTWTVPTQTTDRALVKPGHLGATRVCRGEQPVLADCGEPAGEVAAQFAVGSLPSAQWFGRGRQPGRETERVKKPVVGQSQQPSVVHVHRVLERTVEKADL